MALQHWTFLMEDDLCLKTTLDGRRPEIKDNFPVPPTPTFVQSTFYLVLYPWSPNYLVLNKSCSQNSFTESWVLVSTRQRDIHLSIKHCPHATRGHRDVFLNESEFQKSLCRIIYDGKTNNLYVVLPLDRVNYKLYSRASKSNRRHDWQIKVSDLFWETCLLTFFILNNLFCDQKQSTLTELPEWDMSVTSVSFFSLLVAEQGIVELLSPGK